MKCLQQKAFYTPKKPKNQNTQIFISINITKSAKIFKKHKKTEISQTNPRDAESR